MELQGYRSFLVRLWNEPASGGAGSWCGEVEHIQSGLSWRFASLEALLGFFATIAVGYEVQMPSAPVQQPNSERSQ